jgi:hypothetical protein
MWKKRAGCIEGTHEEVGDEFCGSGSAVIYSYNLKANHGPYQSTSPYLQSINNNTLLV